MVGSILQGKTDWDLDLYASGVSTFPVTLTPFATNAQYTQGGFNATYKQITYRLLKDLKAACSQYGVNSLATHRDIRAACSQCAVNSLTTHRDIRMGLYK